MNKIDATEMVRQARKYWKNGHLEQAISTYQVAIELAPQSPHAYYDLATLLDFQGGDAAEIVGTLQHFVTLAIKNPNLASQVENSRKRIAELEMVMPGLAPAQVMAAPSDQFLQRTPQAQPSRQITPTPSPHSAITGSRPSPVPQKRGRRKWVWGVVIGAVGLALVVCVGVLLLPKLLPLITPSGSITNFQPNYYPTEPAPVILPTIPSAPPEVPPTGLSPTPVK